MSKKRKLATPEWIKEGYSSEEEYNKKMGIGKKKKEEKTFKIRECPECGSDEVAVVLSGSDSEEGGGKEWECKKCKWKGENIIEKELTESEFIKLVEEKK